MSDSISLRNRIAQALDPMGSTSITTLRNIDTEAIVQAWRDSLPEDTLLIAQITPADWARLYAALEGKS